MYSGRSNSRLEVVGPLHDPARNPRRAARNENDANGIARRTRSSPDRNGGNCDGNLPGRSLTLNHFSKTWLTWSTAYAGPDSDATRCRHANMTSHTIGSADSPSTASLTRSSNRPYAKRNHRSHAPWSRVSRKSRTTLHITDAPFHDDRSPSDFPGCVSRTFLKATHIIPTRRPTTR